MSTSSKDFGKEGEELAAQLLISKGYEIIVRNYRYKDKGELDIIAKDPATGYTVFVEVKSKTNLQFGEPEYSVTKNKIRQIKRMAEAYLFEKEITELPCRFDVVTVLKRSKQSPLINHYINAFD
ncbi:MAG TPA: YraN family protein [Ignavibacteriaceae bacterium]|nr:YraN family protein [Ignavibacteriaceae bacterium]